MRLFLYGTLLDPDVLARRAGTPGLGARMVPATLPGYRRTNFCELIAANPLEG